MMAKVPFRRRPHPGPCVAYPETSVRRGVETLNINPVLQRALSLIHDCITIHSQQPAPSRNHPDASSSVFHHDEKRKLIPRMDEFSEGAVAQSLDGCSRTHRNP